MNALLNNRLSLTPTNILGDWYNQRGSILHISRIAPNGRVNGHYESPKGTKGERFSLDGVINYATPTTRSRHDIVISFTVNWGDYGSITSWVGFFEKKGNIIHLKTRWHLATTLRFNGGENISSAIDIFTKRET